MRGEGILKAVGKVSEVTTSRRSMKKGVRARDSFLNVAALVENKNQVAYPKC